MTKAAHHDVELLSDDEALFKELENEEDAEIAFLRERRINEIKQEMERRQGFEENQHGQYTEIENEKEFMDITVKEKYVVGHFFHKDFRRCKIMHTHLKTLAKTFYQTRFISIDVQNAPFLVQKLQVQVLPCLMAWINGFAQARFIGFDDLGNSDGFPTALLEQKLILSGVLKKKSAATNQNTKSIKDKFDSDSDDDLD